MQVVEHLSYKKQHEGNLTWPFLYIPIHIPHPPVLYKCKSAWNTLLTYKQNTTFLYKKAGWVQGTYGSSPDKSAFSWYYKEFILYEI